MRVLFVQDQMCGRTAKLAQLLRDSGADVSLVELSKSSPLADYSLFDEHLNLPFDRGLATILKRGRKIRSTLEKWLQSRAFDVVHTCNEPDYFGAWLPTLTAVPVVHDLHDLATERPPTSSTPLHNLAIRYLHRRWEAQAARRAAVLLTTSPMMADYLQKKYGHPHVHAITNKVPPQEFVRRAKLSAADGRVHVVYSGGLSLDDRSQRSLLPTLQQMAGNGVEVHVYPVAIKAAERQAIRKACERSAALHFHEPVPQARMIEELSQFDLGVVWNMDPENTNVRFTTPNKLYEYQVAGLGILTNLSDGYVGRYVREKGCGVVVADAEEARREIRKKSTYNLDPGDCFLEPKELLRVYADAIAVPHDRAPGNPGKLV